MAQWTRPKSTAGADLAGARKGRPGVLDVMKNPIADVTRLILPLQHQLGHGIGVNLEVYTIADLE